MTHYEWTTPLPSRASSFAPSTLPNSRPPCVVLSWSVLVGPRRSLRSCCSALHFCASCTPRRLALRRSLSQSCQSSTRPVLSPAAHWCIPSRCAYCVSPGNEEWGGAREVCVVSYSKRACVCLGGRRRTICSFPAPAATAPSKEHSWCCSACVVCGGCLDFLGREREGQPGMRRQECEGTCRTDWGIGETLNRTQE